MDFPLIKTVSSKDENIFLSFWEELYSYSQEPIYIKLIIKEAYTVEDIRQLYTWKNRMKLSTRKENTLQKKIIPKLMLINNFKKNGFAIEDFQKEFAAITAVWKIFLLHIISPKEYPIYDQNVHRACLYLQGHNHDLIKLSTLPDSEKERFYFDTYLSFIQRTFPGIEYRKIDKALFTFGQFLNSEIGGKMLNSQY